MEFFFENLTQGPFWVAVVQIIGIDIILAGDNAVVIALACMHLPPKQRLWGMILGAGIAVLMRIFFTLIVSQALGVPFLKLVGGVLLLWVAIKLIVPEPVGDDSKVQAADSLWRAVRIIAIADIVMSLDNVIAIAASAEAAAAQVDPTHALALKTTLIVFGLATSVPLIVAGSALLMRLLERFPIMVIVGGGLLGWVAGDIMIEDKAVLYALPENLVNLIHHFPLPGDLSLNIPAVAGCAFVLCVSWLILRSRRQQSESPA